MASHSPGDIFAEFYIDGDWERTYDGEDLSARVRGGDSIIITRGGSDQFSSITSQSATFTLNNSDNLFTDDDPNSPLYRKFGQSTRCRFGIENARGLDLYARFGELPVEPNGERIYTADKATLDITGDIDIRWEMDLRWTRDYAHMIGGKYTLTGNQRSWLVALTSDGRINLRHTTDGTTGTVVSQSSTVSIVSEAEGRKAYRITLDVNDGAGNKVYTWYTSDSITGTWTQVDTATVAGTTSIFSSTAELAIGTTNLGFVALSNVYPFAGKMYRFRVYSGIGGTLVADFDPNADSGGLGDTTWADTCATPNTWVIDTSGTNAVPAIRLGSDQVRFTGEIQTRPDDWDLTGADRWCPMTAAGLLSHYSSNRAALLSPLRRYWSRQSGLVGYWPMEDGDDSTAVSSGIDGGTRGNFVNCSFGSVTNFGGSTGALEIDTAGSSTIDLYASTHTASGAWSIVFYFKLDAVPATTQVLVNIYPTGSNVARWAFQVGLTAYTFTAYSSTGASLATSTVAFGSEASPLTNWIAMSMTFKQEGGNIRWETSWNAVGSSTTYTHFAGGTTFTGTVGTVRRMYFIPTDSNLSGIQIAHVAMLNLEFEINATTFTDVSDGYAGETFGKRWTRLLTEEGIAHDWVGWLDDTEAVGSQPADTLYSILERGARTDGGLVCEARDTIALMYVTGKALGNRTRLELSYDDSHLSEPPRPTGTHNTVNDFIAQRDSGGGSARYEATDTRRKNVRNPDDASPGVGRFERSDTYNAALDSRLYDLASFRVFIGTWDERTIPTLAVSTHRTEISGNATLLASVISQDIGDPLSIIETVGSPLPPNDVLCAGTGYRETIRNMTRDIVFNTVPQGPYQTPVFDSTVTDYEPRLDAEDETTTLFGALTTTATSVTWQTLTSSSAPFWVDDTNYPDDIGGGETIDIDINGERITVTSITAPTSSVAMTQTGTFESGVSGWNPTDSTFVQSSTFAHAGTYSGLLTVVGSPAYAYVRQSTGIPCVEGASYTASIWVRSATTVTCSVAIDWLDEDSNYLSTDASGASLSSGSWVNRTVTATAPAGAAYMKYGPTLTSAAAGTVLYLDDVTMTSSSLNYQTATLIRSVNSVVKAHSAGDAVRLFTPAYLGRI